MKITSKRLVDVVTDVQCDVCGESTSDNGRYGPQFGVLQASWGYGSAHDGESYQVHLCEGCFFTALATLKEQHSRNKASSGESCEPGLAFGLVEGSNEIL